MIAEGAHVLICARGEEALKKAAASIAKAAASGARVAYAVADVSTEAGAKTIVDAAVREFGGIDVVVNNVGVAKGADLESTTDAEWQEAFDQTLFPAVRVSRHGRAAHPQARRRRDRRSSRRSSAANQAAA